MDADFMDTVLTNILAASDENSMDFTAIFPQKICASMQELYPRFVILQIDIIYLSLITDRTSMLFC